MDPKKIKILSDRRGVDETAIKSLGDLALGRISAWHYDYNHKSKMNADFVKAFNAEFKRNPDFFAVGGYDGMHLIYETLKKTGGKTDGDRWSRPPRASSGKARAGRCPSIRRPAKSCKTSISAGWKKSATTSSMLNSITCRM